MTESDNSSQFTLPTVEDVFALFDKLNSAVADIKDDADISARSFVDQAKRSVESVASTLQTIQQSLENFNRVALRVDKLLDDVEGPIRKFLGAMTQQATELTED